MTKKSQDHSWGKPVKTIRKADPNQTYTPSFFIKFKGAKDGLQTELKGNYSTPQKAREMARMEYKKLVQNNIIDPREIKAKSFHVISKPKIKTSIDNPWGF